jgi:hypothetical protein
VRARATTKQADCSSTDHGGGKRKAQAVATVERDLWHADCFVNGMTNENYFLVLFQIACLLMFSCGVVVLTQHPEWFGV